MDYQEYMKDATQKAADEAFRYAKAVPDEKVAWKASDTSRSVLQLCQEMALCGKWAAEIIEDKPMPEWSEETQAKVQQEMDAFPDVDACKAECDRNLKALFALFSTLSDDDLKRTKWLPYDGGRDFTVAEMMDYPRWNFTYHLGQIAFVQTLYGDKDMH
ncbi:MAG: DinB family protein [Armatimonadetes bacterium]|nr:DinB family protein [Armatimonadota bacterium]